MTISNSSRSQRRQAWPGKAARSTISSTGPWIQPQAYGENQLQLTMDTDHTVMAVYDWRLPGDANRDDLVDLLDIIYIRGKLYTGCSD